MRANTICLAVGAALASTLLAATVGTTMGAENASGLQQAGSMTSAQHTHGVSPEFPPPVRQTAAAIATAHRDPLASEQWALAKVGLTGTLHLVQVRDVLVAVLDTGIDSTHEDLEGSIAGAVNFTASATAGDSNGHGTHVAGIIAALTGNRIGISGIAPRARLLNVKVADDYGLCRPEDVARGIVWAADNGAHVINISLELRHPSADVQQAVDYAWARGAIVIAAAGNDAGQKPVYPAYYDKTLAVAATTPTDRLAPLSNSGDWVDVAAPGFKILSTLPRSTYGYETGTSFAAAHVSGLAALLFSVVSDLNDDGRLNDEVRRVIEASSLYIPGLNTAHGRIDAAAALSLADAMRRSAN